MPVVVSASPIHGLGLFAGRALRAGDFLCAYRGELIPKAESRRRAESRPAGACVYTVAFDDEHDLDGDLPDNPAKHANHACAANAELVREGDGLVLRAARPIAAGEEICFDYGYGLADAVRHPCRCGKPGCVGRILAAPLRPLYQKLARR